MTPLSLALFFSLAADPPVKSPPADTSKPVGATRDAEKELLEQHKQAKPRLPLPPDDARGSGANNGAMRAYYIPAELRDGGGGGREPDPAMTLDSTFKVKLFWIASRSNNCFY
jgi:hypothetical protein